MSASLWFDRERPINGSPTQISLGSREIALAVAAGFSIRGGASRPVKFYTLAAGSP